MSASMKGVEALYDELEKAKEGLKDVDENIKKLTGRDPLEQRFGQRRQSATNERRVSAGGQRERRVSTNNDPDRGDIRGRLFNIARRGIVEEGDEPPAKRRAPGAFSRLGPRVGESPRVAASRINPRRRPDSGDEDEEGAERPAIQSSVVATPKDTRTRQEALETQNKDKQGNARGRRMFGLLLGTLQRFKDDSRKVATTETKRKEIEEKLEHKALEEKEELKRERQALFQERRAKQQQLKKLENKMEMVKVHEEWEQQTILLMSFIRTKAKPHIFFAPKGHTAVSQKRLEDTRKILEEVIAERKSHLEDDIEDFSESEDVKMPQENEASGRHEKAGEERKRRASTRNDNWEENRNGASHNTGTREWGNKENRKSNSSAQMDRRRLSNREERNRDDRRRSPSSDRRGRMGYRGRRDRPGDRSGERNRRQSREARKSRDRRSRSRSHTPERRGSRGKRVRKESEAHSEKDRSKSRDRSRSKEKSAGHQASPSPAPTQETNREKSASPERKDENEKTEQEVKEVPMDSATPTTIKLENVELPPLPSDPDPRAIEPKEEMQE